MSDQTERLGQALADRYRVERELGAGGMATVYLAEDLRHQRKVALKVLRPELAAVLGGERFLSEIRTTANLQHPHILALFDSGEADGFLYYVMPYIDGETLRDRLDREKQLGVEESVRIVKSVADALDYAHRNGVIHRDIKPANILLHDGRPVVADFGIAVAVSAAGGGRMTETGLSLGTPHYMSPEQASADRDLTARSDVYSLGCVLYEMIAGQPPHTGPSAQSILVRILTDAPRPLTELRHTVPMHVSAVVLKAIEKLPADRFESARAFMDALDDPAFTWAPAAQATTTRAAASATAAMGTTRRRAWALPAAVGVVAAIAGIITGRQMSGRDPDVAPRVVFTLETDSTSRPARFCCGPVQTVSPDGTQLAYLGLRQNVRYIFVRPVDQVMAQLVPGTRDARHPVFNADGSWLAFNSATGLMKIPVEGGTPLTVAEGVGSLRGIAWLEDNTIVIGTNVPGEGLFRVSADGGTPEPITTPDSAAGELAHRYPHALPGGSTILFVIVPVDTDNLRTIAALDLASGRITPLMRGTSPGYVDSGHVLYGMPDGSVMAQQLDIARLDTIGGPFRVAEGVAHFSTSMTEFGVSRSGTLLTLQDADRGANDLVIVDRSDVETMRLSFDGALRHPRFSPDGRFIAVEVEGERGAGSAQIWVLDIDQRNPSRITTEGSNSSPSWTPDGQSVLFGRTASGTISGVLFEQRIDGTGAARPVQSGVAFTAELSSDGQWLVWLRHNGAELDILARPWADTAAAPINLGGPSSGRSPAVSRDSRWLAWVSNAADADEVYVRSFPQAGPVTKISVNGGRDPRWHPAGTSLLYRAPDGQLMEAAVRVEGNSLVVVERTSVLDATAYRTMNNSTNWDIHRDGDRFVFVTGGDGASVQHRVTLNVTSRQGQR